MEENEERIAVIVRDSEEPVFDGEQAEYVVLSLWNDGTFSRANLLPAAYAGLQTDAENLLIESVK